MGNALCDLCKHALDVQLALLHVQLALLDVQLALLHVQLASLYVQLAYLMCNLHYANRSRCILRRAVRIPRDPTAVTLSGCDDRWTRVELDPTPADTLFLVTDNSDGKS